MILVKYIVIFLIFFGTHDHSTDNNILIANLSTNDITLGRSGQTSNIQPKSIDWFKVGVSGQVTGHVIRNGDKPVNAIIYTMTSAKSTNIEAKRGIAPNQSNNYNNNSGYYSLRSFSTDD